MAISELPHMFVPPKNQADQAQEAQDDLKRLFPTMVMDDIEGLRMAFNDIRMLDEPHRSNHLRNRFPQTLHRLQTQGAVFGYPLVSDVARHLNAMIQNHQTLNKEQLGIIQNDLNLLQRIIWKKISGDGGETGRKILNQLV